uniref:MADF domain-containing protein n=1 Tax=Caenorhabditis tropicalis TaxID=1561998 RepID=A0A1I7TPJ0_9PELO
MSDSEKEILLEEDDMNREFLSKDEKNSKKQTKVTMKANVKLEKSLEKPSDDAVKAARGRKVEPKLGASYRDYDVKDVLYFLTLVEESPSLWDHSIDNSHRKENRVHLFDEIEELCKKFMSRGKVHDEYIFGWQHIEKMSFRGK